MYWPIGTPNAYALSKQVIEQARITSSQDGLNSEAGLRELENKSSSDNGDRRPNGTLSANHELTRTDEAAGDQATGDIEDNIILAVRPSRGGSIFASITKSTLTIWQAKPVLALASIVRSLESIKAYGPNVDLLIRPDALLIVVQTTEHYLILYSVAEDPNARVYRVEQPDANRHARRSSVDGYGGHRRASFIAGFDAGVDLVGDDGIKEVNLRFRLAMRIDAGISSVLALDHELVVATVKPAALQCIRWPPSENLNTKLRPKTSTELLGKFPWISGRCSVLEMVHDRPMNLTCWVASDGRAYAVQRRSSTNVDMDDPASLFRGYCFRESNLDEPESMAVKAAINARFSLIAIACVDGSIYAYVVKDYMGNIPLSHNYEPAVTSTESGSLRCLTFSPDGYCLFAGYEHGWIMWSVYGKLLAFTFPQNRRLSKFNDESWLQGIKDAFWLGGGCELVMLGTSDDRLWSIELARNAASTCFAPENLLRGLLLSSNDLKMYKGHDVANSMNLSSDATLWQTVQIPTSYLLRQWPVKAGIISPDGKYIAVAGRRGLAHYSTVSGRWRVFDDTNAEREFTVRGGMCWYQHYLITSVESDGQGAKYQIRVYSREKALNKSNIEYTQDLAAPAIYISTIGSDSLLVYTHDNTLLHFIIAPHGMSIRLVQVGQIGFHGIIRAPTRVRSISWILPEDQQVNGDPSQDVARASVLFLVDGKLVLLQPSTNEQGDLKYDMKVIAQNVEYYFLLRDMVRTRVDHASLTDAGRHSLQDSLWYFDGNDLHVWLDVQDLLACAPAEIERELPPAVRIPVGFYPMIATDSNGIINGLDADLVQRQDVNFSLFRLSVRTQLFLPQMLRHHLAEYNSAAALYLSESYQHLPYFPHALEVLLHDILDTEVDNPPPPDEALLPTAISFLSSFQCYLDVIVNCTRKTELRSWRTLFSYLPPALELFEQALDQGKLKTAAGYLLVLHTMQLEEEEDGFEGREYARLLTAAVAAHDWELCGELARFLVGIDDTGDLLRSALALAGLNGTTNGILEKADSDRTNGQSSTHSDEPERLHDGSGVGAGDYFPSRP